MTEKARILFIDHPDGDGRRVALAFAPLADEEDEKKRHLQQVDEVQFPWAKEWLNQHRKGQALQWVAYFEADMTPEAVVAVTEDWSPETTTVLDYSRGRTGTDISNSTLTP
jgi:hypothetical protein